MRGRRARRRSPASDVGSRQRRLGRLTEAQANLDTCVRLCDELGLGTIRVHARREQAELYAATGDFREAFEEHKRILGDPLSFQAIMAGMQATWWLS